jgi:hypothetical protein
MDGQEIMGRAVKVDFAKENPDRIQARADAEKAKEEDPNEIPEF